MDRQQLLRALLAVGGLVIVVGLAVGLIPMHQGPISCGSLFAPANPYSMGSVAGMDACDAAASTRKGVVWTLIGIGGIVAGLAGLKMLGDREQQSEAASPADQPAPRR